MGGIKGKADESWEAHFQALLSCWPPPRFWDKGRRGAGGKLVLHVSPACPQLLPITHRQQ